MLAEWPEDKIMLPYAVTQATKCASTIRHVCNIKMSEEDRMGPINIGEHFILSR